MGEKHKRSRFGETWSSDEIAALKRELAHLRRHCIVSGGWAWHLLTPNHTEYKHLHDHRDLDLFVPPQKRGSFVSNIKQRGFERDKTRFDNAPTKYDFCRYKKIKDGKGQSRKIIIDSFIGLPPAIPVGKFYVVEPVYMLGFYETVHGSDQCWAVKQAMACLDKGKHPAFQSELAQPPASVSFTEGECV